MSEWQSHYGDGPPRLVPPIGPLSAQVALVGEAPGADEESRGEPFVGYAGKILDSYLRKFGLKRASLWIDNVVPWRPVKNDISLVPQEELERFGKELLDRLALLPNLNIVVALGGTALKALSGPSFSSISKWRGSLRGLSLPDGRTVKLMPTFHPAFLARAPLSTPAAESDWRKVSQEAPSPFVVNPPPERRFLLSPNQEDREWFKEECERAEALSVDIETNPSTGEIICVGFAPSPLLAACVPWRSWQERAFIKDLLEGPLPKIGQAFLYDASWLERLGYRVHNWQWDTLYMHHALSPAEPHSLAYLASIFTNEPFWKDEAKGGEDANEKGVVLRPSASWETYQRYNCKDAAATFEIAQILSRLLEERGLLSFYREHYQELFPALLEMQVRGMRVDGQARAERADSLTQELDSLKETLREKSGGAELIGKTALSTKKLSIFLYGKGVGQLRLPEQKIRAKGAAKRKKGALLEEEEPGLSTGEPTIKRLLRAYPGACPLHCLSSLQWKSAEAEHLPECPGAFAEIGSLILKIRRAQQLSTFYNPDRIDSDGRFRFSIKPNTATGRLSSSESPWGGGSNAQNIDREARGMYLPEIGQFFLEFDLSQVESRICLFLLGTPALGDSPSLKAEKERMRWFALSLPWEFDGHTENARGIFPGEEITKPKRHLGKIISHGAQRGMGAKTLQEAILKEADLLLPLPDCEKFLENYHRAHPLLKPWFRSIRFQVADRVPLKNSWGRSLSFEWERLGDPLYQAAYSFPMQSEAAGLIMRAGLVPSFEFLQKKGMKSRLVLQVHDSLLFSVEPSEAWDLYSFVCASLAQPIQLPGGPLPIPLACSAGKNWTKELELKKPARSREELEEWLSPILSTL